MRIRKAEVRSSEFGVESDPSMPLLQSLGPPPNGYTSAFWSFENRAGSSGRRRRHTPACYLMYN